MKKALIIIGGILAFLLLVLISIPIIFKDKIRAKVDAELAKSVNADIYLDDFSLSLIRNFPNVTATLEDFSVVGKDTFRGDTLISAKSFRVVINLKSVLFDDNLTINAIDIQSPNILVKVLENGKANYDIMIGEEEQPVEETEPSEFSIGIESWNISNGNLIYDDRSMNLLTVVKGLNHSGKGDFTQDIFDLSTETEINALSIGFDNVQYLTNKKIEADVVLNMNLPESKYTFKENTAKVNDFAFGFDGFVAMPGDDIDMDITYAAKNNSFKSILSLVPGVYKEGFEKVKTEGNVDFKGFVKGTYNEAKNLMPAFNLNLLVDNGMFQYPDLPTAITNINLAMLVDNKDGVINNTLIDISKFHMDLGKNPVDAKLRVEGLERSKILADVKAKLNLAELTDMFPVEGTQLKGLFNVDIIADGVYDSAASSFPSVTANMAMNNGYVKTADFPAPLENVNFVSKVVNETGKMEDTEIWVNDYNMVLDGEKLAARLYLKNLNDYTWDLALNGVIDLEKITKIYSLENMELSGRIAADIATKGSMSDLEAERYDKMPTSGIMSVKNFKYTSPDLPQGFLISDANMKFDPDKMVISNFDGAAGKTDIKIDGFVSNYIGYMVKDDQVLRGTMNFTSNKVDLNEWMTEEEAPADTASSEPMEVIVIPKNIDFTLNSKINQVLFTDLVLNNVHGTILVKNGVARMDNVNFSALDGQFGIDGIYDTQNPQKPVFDLGLNIRDLSISKAYESFNTVKAMAPIAEKVNGKFSTEFKMNGQIGKDMMPVLPTLAGAGLIKIAQASLTDSKLIGGLTKVTKLSDSDQVSMKDVIMQAEIKDGRLHVKPFDVQVGKYKTVVEGSNGIDGSLDYRLKMDIPAGAAGAAVNNAIASLTGKASSGSSNILLNLNVGGTYEDPKFGLGGAEAGESVQDQAKAKVEDRVNEEVDKAKEEFDARKKEAEEKARQELEARRKEAEEKAKQEIEEQRKETEAKVKEETDKAKEKAKDQIKGLFKKN